MIKYSSNIDRNKVVVTLILLSVVIATIFNVIFTPLLHFLSSIYENSIPQIVSLFSVLGFSIGPITYQFSYSKLRKLYENSLWKSTNSFFKYLNEMPDISGEWKGYISSKRQEEGKCIRRELKMIVHQDFNNIHIICSFYDSKRNIYTSISDSIVVSLDNRESEFVLKFAFENRSKELGTPTPQYQGYNQLRITQDRSEMEGYYFTGREPEPSNGLMYLKKV